MEYLGVSQSYIDNWINKRSVPQIATKKVVKKSKKM